MIDWIHLFICPCVCVDNFPTQFFLNVVSESFFIPKMQMMGFQKWVFGGSKW
jgi:hypothetical protein